MSRKREKLITLLFIVKYSRLYPNFLAGVRITDPYIRKSLGFFNNFNRGLVVVVYKGRFVDEAFLAYFRERVADLDSLACSRLYNIPIRPRNKRR